MAVCKFCGADVHIGSKCSYCGSTAEPWYYPDYKEPKKFTGIQGKPPISVNSYYTVDKGDTLWHIAKRAYGEGILYTHIVKANKEIKNPNLIYYQQKIFIPDIGEEKLR